MTNLLLITDIPRLRKIFSRFSDEKDIHLRIANNLEKGGEEIIADKPAMVFVQTHLSGLSPDILLMHLKKQLGRRRSRFVLLTPPEQVSDETLKLYQGHLDTSLDDNALSDSIREMIASLAPKGRKSAATASAASDSGSDQITLDDSPPQTLERTDQPSQEAPSDLSVPPETPAIAAPLQLTDTPEPSLEEQGVTYAPRARVSVYSEFTSSFDNAVSSIQPATTADDSHMKEHAHDWSHEEIETIEPGLGRSKRATFILWFTPLLLAVVVVTIIQHNRANNKPLDIPAQTPTIQTQAAAKPVTSATPEVATKQIPGSVAPASPSGPQPVNQAASTTTDTQLSDKAVLQAIAESRVQKPPSKDTTTSPRLTTLPDFIPRAGLDKAYSAANPGWERYKGNVTEFKIYRENDTIKAIQVIDRGGQGVPESFMKAALRQITGKPNFVMESSEKKDGYEIQRGQVAENLKVVYYRDEKGGRLRAFVTTWK